MTRIILFLVVLIGVSVFLFFIFIPLGVVFALMSAFMPVFLISQYNIFVHLEETVNQKWADINTVLQQRSDLSARVVEILKDCVKHEYSTLKDVTKARKQLSEAKSLNEKINSAEKFESGMGKLLVISERYPDLKANVSFNKMIDALTSLEKDISESRKEFNQAVRDYKVVSKKFPSNIAFTIIGPEEIDYFNISENNGISSEADFDDQSD